MNIQAAKDFFKWCTIVNFILFTLSAIMILLCSDFIYSFHGQMFNMPREALDIVLYAFLGLYKIFFIVFNIVPYAALVIMAKKENQSD